MSSPRDGGGAQLYPQVPDSIFVAFEYPKGYGGDIQIRLHTEYA
jgi:hypothetical protein